MIIISIKFITHLSIIRIKPFLLKYTNPMLQPILLIRLYRFYFLDPQCFQEHVKSIGLEKYFLIILFIHWVKVRLLLVGCPWLHLQNQ